MRSIPALLLALACADTQAPPPAPRVDTDDRWQAVIDDLNDHPGQWRNIRPGGPSLSGPTAPAFEGLGVRGEGVGGGLGIRGSGLGGGGAADGIGGLGGTGSGPGKGFGGRLQGGPVQTAAARAPLRAGHIDDNADLPAFLRYLDGLRQRPDTRGRWQDLDVRGARHLRVLDSDGRGLPGATVVLQDGGRELAAARTRADGAVTVYAGDASPDATWVVRADGQEGSVGLGDAVLRLPVRRADGAVPLDLAFILDTTGSMGDELDALRATLIDVVRQVQERHPTLDLQIGGVAYRDLGDAYTVARHPLIGDAAVFVRSLDQLDANGGGDTPEHLNAGLHEAVHGLKWRPDAAHVAFLIADAAPHMEHPDAPPYGTTAADAAARAIRVHTVAASGLDPIGSAVFRQIAQRTSGRFIFLEYGSTAASARAHGIEDAEQLTGNNLDRILIDRLDAEITAWRQP